jgi:pectate lyase
MKKKFTKVVCATLAATMVITAAPFADFSLIPQFAVETEAATAINAVAEGKHETVYAEWTPVSDAAKYEAYIKSGSGAYTQVDDELIRQYPTYWRVDVPGLKAGTYDLKVVAKDSNGSEVATFEKTNISVSAYDRVGFAFSKNSTYKTGSGAYNDDGTIKSNAKVIYVTADTAKTVTADLVVDSKKGTTQTFTGLQAILGAKEKGTDTTPIDIRIIGTIEASDMDSLGSSAEGLQIKGKKSYSELNITIEGIGNDAAINGFGILLRNAGNVELRNFAVLNCMDDSISIDTDNCNLWVHNLDLFYGQAGGDADQAKGDGATDTKAATTYVTIANNHYWDSGKSILCGMSSDCYTDYYVTFANNWFDHSDSRHPRIRGGNIHVYNNYYDGNAKYGVGMTTGGSAFVENNYFRDCKDPMLISKQGTDAKGDGTFSGEDGGYIKEYGNIMVGTYYFLPGEDAYCATSRDEQVPSSYVANVVNDGVVYSNFDTNSSVIYDYTVLDAKDVPAYVTENAGRINHGDLTYEFDNAIEDTNYAVISELKSAVTNYKTTLVSVGGTVTNKTVSGTASSVTGVDGNKTVFDPAAKLATLNLPDETDTNGNKATGGTGGTQTTSYDLLLKLSDISSATLSANKEIQGSVGTFEILASSDKQVTLDSSKGVQLGGSGSTSVRAIKFTTTSAGTIKVTGASTGSDTRTINISDGSSVIGTIATGASTTVDLPAAGTYYVYSAGKGINISFIGVTYNDDNGGNDKPVEEDAIWGDADDSGALTANDSAMIVLYALDPVSANLSEKAIKYSDVNADGKLSAEDAAMVLQKTLDAEYVFPALKN